MVGSLVGRVLPRQRVGMTVKGDVGDFGLYGAVGRYFEEGIETSMSYLVGADYSFGGLLDRSRCSLILTAGT